MRHHDLNLLRVFDILYEERSVTRAASRLGLTQSAVSHALTRLRGAFEDRLFARGPGGFSPTARAVELAPRIHDILVSIRDALASPSFDPRTSERSFTIAGGQYFAALVFPALVACVRSEAPGVTLRLVSIDQALADDLDEGVVDLAVGAFEDVPARFDTGLLLEDEMVWVAAAGHPRIATLARPAAIVVEKRVDIVVNQAPRPLRADRPRDVLGRRLSSEHIVLNGLQERRESYGVQVYDAETALAIVAMTDLVALVPCRSVAAYTRRDALRILSRPDPASPIRLLMLWQRRFADEPGRRWVRQLVRKLA